jgi:hypothetical protein
VPLVYWIVKCEWNNYVFTATNYCHLFTIIEAILKACSTATKLQISDRIGKYLIGAPGRKGGMGRRRVDY